MTPCPDLLGHEPDRAPPGPELQQALTFAFTTGGPQPAFDRAVPRPGDRDRTWQATCFTAQLFLGDLVGRCLALPKDASRQGERPGRTAALLAVLEEPPPSPDAIRFRQTIAEELASSPEARAAAIRVHTRISEWRALLEAPGGAHRMDPMRRRIEILYATRALVDLTAESFGAARSGLRRLSEWAAALSSVPAFETLRRLLADEAHLATVEVAVRLDRDGELRRYDIVRVGEQHQNPFRVGPWARLWSRLLLLVLGHRVRRDEVASRLVDGVFEGVQAEVSRFFQIHRDLDFHLGAVGFRDRALARGLAVCLPEIDPGASGARRIAGLFNPFLLGDDERPTPCDVDLPHGGIVIVTGPNSGGKTRFIEAIAVLQVLAHAGVWVPAASAAIPWARGLFASLHRSDHLLDREGGLGTELLRIKDIFERLEVGGLVVVDELCSGTNPSEGEEIFEVVIDLLAEMRVQAFITTHFLRFASELHAARRASLSFLRVDLDANERPTYRFVPGVARTSLARQTAERLGVTREELGALVALKIRRAAEPDGSLPSEPAPPPDLDARGGTS